MDPSVERAIEKAFEQRQPLLSALHAEKTNAYRLFHGTAEGLPGLTIDRYGPLLLVQTFREPLTPDELQRLETLLRRQHPDLPHFVYNHRGKAANQKFNLWHEPRPEALGELQCQEFGSHYCIRARHPGIDPWLFLDLRAGRRYLRERAKGCTVLNLFSYTCSVGLTAAVAGASEVWNVDFAASHLEVGTRNAELNQIPEGRFRTIQEDCLPVMRQLADLSIGGRFGQKRKTVRLEPKTFDFVILDPPAWSKGAFGAVDVVGDYASLFKPAVHTAKPQVGTVIATNHVASVELEAWIDSLKRCADKAGRPIRNLQVLQPEADFPSYDGRPPLKIAVCEV